MTNPILKEIERLTPGYEFTVLQKSYLDKASDPDKVASVLGDRLLDARVDAARYLGIDPSDITLHQAMGTIIYFNYAFSSSSGSDAEFASRLGLKTILEIGKNIGKREALPTLPLLEHPVITTFRKVVGRDPKPEAITHYLNDWEVLDYSQSKLEKAILSGMPKSKSNKEY